MFNYIKLKAENKRLKEELEKKELTIQYLNGCVSRANSRYMNLLNFINGKFAGYAQLDFPNSQLEGQMSISDILEN